MIKQIGGVFMMSEDPQKLAEWYEKHLNLKYEYYEEYNVRLITFFYNDEETAKKYYSVWSVMQSATPVPENKNIRINFRVDDLEKVVKHIRSLGTPIKDIETHPQGKFTWVTDPDGNEVELWEDTESGTHETE